MNEKEMWINKLTNVLLMRFWCADIASLAMNVNGDADNETFESVFQLAETHLIEEYIKINFGIINDNDVLEPMLEYYMTCITNFIDEYLIYTWRRQERTRCNFARECAITLWDRLYEYKWMVIDVKE